MTGEDGHSENGGASRSPAAVGAGNAVSGDRDFAHLFELLSDAILITQDRRIVFANSAAAEMHGAEAVAAMLGHNAVDLVHPVEHATLETRRTAIVEGRRIEPAPQRRLRLDGTAFLAESRGSQTVWQGRPAILVVLRDITERIRAEQLLRESERRLRGLIESFPLGIQIMSLDSRRLYVNQSFLDLLGFDSKDEVYALPRIADFVEPHDRERINEFRQARERGGPVPSPFECDMRRTNGAVRTVQVFSSPIIWNGLPAHQQVFIDLTERKRAEQALKESEARLQQAQKMEAVGQLTGGIAHDFNNLLTVVIGNFELLAGRLKTAEDLDLVNAAMQSGLRGATLTQQLLAFSRKQPLAPRLADLNEIVAGLAELMRRVLGETVEIELAGAEGLWRCEVDYRQLENAILNLAINARDAMPAGGRLTIATANRRVEDAGDDDPDALLAGDYVTLSVADTGVGIPPDQIEHVFEPFFTTKEVGEGSGLGLSMVYGFIRQSGGHVAIESEPGAGTAVTLYLPRVRTGDGRPHVEDDRPAEPPTARGERILIVEDDPSVRELVVALLGDLGYRTVETAQGTAALEALDEGADFDLLFTDMVLPGPMTGSDVAHEARRRVPGIKILFCSGYAGAARTDELTAESGVEFISKPFRKAELAVKLRELLDAPAP